MRRPIETRRMPMRKNAGALIISLFWSTGIINHHAIAQQAATTDLQFDEYLVARDKARTWLDQLRVDSVDLLRNNIKGKKKLAEILGVYLTFLHHSRDSADSERIQTRIRELAAQTLRPEYHNMDQCSDKEFKQNSMSYLRVLWLLEQLGQDTSLYRGKLREIKQRLDTHIRQRGPWQQAMFAWYYDRFGLRKPVLLKNATMQSGIISRRIPAEQIDRNQGYELTHEVFVAFNYGLEQSQDRFSTDDLVYLRTTLPALVQRHIDDEDLDLLAELLSSMTFLGFQTDPPYQKGIDYLLDHQNPNGSWGDYEKGRWKWGRYLDQHAYLHTTMVAVQALIERYEGK